MLIVKIVFSYIIGIVLAEYNTIYIPVALTCVAGILCFLVCRFREYWLLLFVISLSNVVALHDKATVNNTADTTIKIEILDKVKVEVSDRLSSLAIAESTRALAQGMLLGNRSEISYGQKQVIREAGMSHIMAISGLHIGVLALFLFLLFKPLRYVGLHRTHRLAIISFIWIYVFLVGAPLSAIRAALMVTLMHLSWVMHRYSNALHNLFSTALIMLLYDTQQLWDAGFQLSFMATLGIILVLPLTKGISKLEQTLAVTFAAQLFTFPIVGYWFHLIPIFGWIQGIVVLPIVTLFVYTILFYMLIPYFSLLAYPADLMSSWILGVASKVSQFEAWILGGRVYIYPTITESVILELAIVGLCVCLRWRKREKTYD